MQRRILLLVIVCIMVVLVSVGVISHMSVSHSIDHSLRTQLTLAGIISRNIDFVLERHLARLHDMSSSGAVDFSDGDWGPEKKALRTAYDYSIFTDGMFLMDLNGNILMTYPHKEGGEINLLGVPAVAQVYEKNQAVISDVYTVAHTQRRVIYVLAPLKGPSGDVVGMVGGEINPTNYMFASLVKPVNEEDNTTIELVDGNGLVIAGNRAERILTSADHDRFLRNLIRDDESFVGRCHSCHGAGEVQADMLAFVPLSIAQWGVSVRNPHSAVFEPSTRLKKGFAVISLTIIAAAIILSVGLSRSIVRPIRMLTEASRKIAEGDLTENVEVAREDEIGVLASSFETMRGRLDDSLRSMRKYNVELEFRVRERTAEIRERKRQLARLLDEGMYAQEEERRRIARELHDETIQALAALGMSLEVSAMALRSGRLTPDMVYETRRKVGGLVDGINRIIHDLRPPVLDDLGLEPAIRWLLEKHLSENGIESRCNLSGLGSMHIDKKTELRLFRVIQECVVNIAKHSGSSFACVSIGASDSSLLVSITDVGTGFDVEGAMGLYGAAGDLKGYGLLGMRERIEQLDGTLRIESYPNEGTTIKIRIPAQGLEVRNV